MPESGETKVDYYLVVSAPYELPTPTDHAVRTQSIYRSGARCRTLDEWEDRLVQ